MLRGWVDLLAGYEPKSHSSEFGLSNKLKYLKLHSSELGLSSNLKSSKFEWTQEKTTAIQRKWGT